MMVCLGWVLDRSLNKSYYCEGEGEELQKGHCFFGYVRGKGKKKILLMMMMMMSVFVLCVVREGKRVEMIGSLGGGGGGL